MPPAHSGHICPECGKSYKAKETLTRHRKNHDATPQYACHLCPSSFRRKDLLSRHIATHESKGDGQLRARRLNNTACERCCQRKLRCDGQHPCDGCAAVADTCVYVDTSATAREVEEHAAIYDPSAYHSPGDAATGSSVGPWTPPSQTDYSSNVSTAWIGLDDLSLTAGPMDIDASSWPWLYEQMYMSNETAWPGNATSVPRLSQSPASDNSGVHSHGQYPHGQPPQDALMQDFVDQGPAPPLANGSQFATQLDKAPPMLDATNRVRPIYPPEPSAAELPANATEPNIDPVSKREKVLDHVVKTSLEYAKRPTLGIWNKKQTSIDISTVFDFDLSLTAPSLFLEHLVRLYFEHFYLLWPFLHRETLETIHRDSPYLYLTLSMIGAAFAGECAWPYHLMLLNTLREQLLPACFSEGMPHHQLEYLSGSLMLLKISYMYFGHSRALSTTQMISGALVYLVRRMDLFGNASLSGQVPFEPKHRIGSRQWLRSENRKHLAIGMMALESDVSILFGTRPLVSAEEFGISLPCPAEIWVASDPEKVASAYTENDQRRYPLFSQLVHLALDVNEPLPVQEPYAMMMIAHGFQAQVWRYSYEYGFCTQQRVTVEANLDSRADGEKKSEDGQTVATDLHRQLNQPARSMKLFWDGREALVQALKRWRQALVSDLPPEKAATQRYALLGAHVLFHLSFMRLLAPLSAIHRLFLDTSQGNAKPFTMQIVRKWISSEHAPKALHHALNTRALLYFELQRSKDQRAKFNILPQFGLFHGAAILWALSGSRTDTPLAIYDPMSRKDIQIQHGTAKKLLQNFAKLLHMIGLQWNGMSSLVAAVRDMAEVEFPRDETTKDESTRPQESSG
ncbi:MAG: hypothetical protein Q9159_003828 [Coniocarpon cinnabarinum]